jgi:hypothetical protein
MTILFDYHINFLSDSENRTKLPFSVFGMTQQGLSHESHSIGNQDAASIYVGKNLIIGAVSDGCTSGENLNGMSSNQIGAHIMSYLAVRTARKLILKKQIGIDLVVEPFQQSMIHDLKRTVNSINPWKFEKTEILKNFFSATIILFIITQNSYILLSCGDGDAFVNAERIELTSSGGKYFTNNLFDLKFDSSAGYLINPEFQIKCLQKGETKNLNNILISTDGFLDSDVEEDSSFRNFFFSGKVHHEKNGFVDRKTEFRTNFLENISETKNGRLWPLDDATFISIQRINKLNS